MIKINNKSYKLTVDNYIPQGTKKNRIIIGNTYSTDMRHYIGWTKRWNGEYTRTAMFTIGIDGTIYQHFSPIYYSNYMDNAELNETSITILMENEGWLIKDLTIENKFINYVGDIYNRKDSIIEKRWRNHNYWAPYSIKQIESAEALAKELCSEFEIPLKVIAHNTNFDEADNYNGILYRSNFGKYYTDISPAWDCISFKNKIEIN